MTVPVDRALVADLRPKALACLREGRVRVVRAVDNPETHDVRRVMALVRSSRPEMASYAVDGITLDSDPLWSCTYRAGMRGGRCPRVAAVQLVTVGLIA